MLFLIVITRESDEEQKLVLVSAHTQPKISRKLPFMETWIPQPPKMLLVNQSLSVFKPKLKVMVNEIFCMIVIQHCYEKYQ